MRGSTAVLQEDPEDSSSGCMSAQPSGHQR